MSVSECLSLICISRSAIHTHTSTSGRGICLGELSNNESPLNYSGYLSKLYIPPLGCRTMSISNTYNILIKTSLPE